MKPLNKQECISMLAYNNFDFEFKSIDYGYIDEDNKVHIFYTDKQETEQVVVF